MDDIDTDMKMDHEKCMGWFNLDFVRVEDYGKK
jgi:hypothetical protein